MSYDDIERREEVLEKYSKNMEGHEYEWIEDAEKNTYRQCRLCFAIKGTYAAFPMCRKTTVWPEIRYKRDIEALTHLRNQREQLNREIFLKLQEIAQHKREMEALKVGD